MKTFSSFHKAVVIGGLVLMATPVAVRPAVALDPTQAPRAETTDCPRDQEIHAPRGGDVKAQSELAK